MSEPKYKIGDLVYIKASAAIGYLESYRVSSVSMTGKAGWRYKIAIRQKPPSEQTVGDRVDLKTEQPYILDESEIVDLCGAYELMIKNLEARLNRARAMYSSTCGAGSEGTIPLPGPNLWG